MNDTVRRFEKKVRGVVGKDVATLINPIGQDMVNQEEEAREEARRGADQQAAAVRQAGEAAAKQAQEAAAQAGRQQELNSARNAAEGAAKDALSKPVENADVQLSGVTDPSSSANASARKRRQTFGIGSNSGVNI